MTSERYVREALLGRGAWGVVHRARDSVIGRVVALKVIAFDVDLPESDRHELAVRSEREARAAGALNHPNIVTLYDAGRSADDASFFIVMEYVEGKTLRQRLAGGPLPPAETARIGRQVAEALHFAHERGIVHRDVKPANILVRDDGVVKLADFGIARMESSELTRSGQSMGSPAYMSPEQALGRAVDSRSDIFSLGVVLYEMIAGRKPFESETLAALCYQIVNDEPSAPSRHNPAVPAAWDALVMKALAKRPEDRFASAAELARELRRLAPSAPSADDAAGTAGVPPPPAGPAAVEASGGTLIPVEPENAPSRIITAGPRSPSAAGRAGLVFPESRSRAARYAPWAAAGVVAAVLAVAGIESWNTPRTTVHVEFSHGLKSGEIVLAVDGRNYWRQTVTGSEEGGFREFARRVSGRPSGHASARLSLPAGERTLTVTVTSGEDRWSDATHRTLMAGGDEVLSIRVRTGLTRGMELEWR